VESGEGTLTVDADARGACQKDEEIVKHFADDVDRPGLLQCANWGAKELSPQQKETFRFLQVVDAGDGTSVRTGGAGRPKFRPPARRGWPSFTPHHQALLENIGPGATLNKTFKFPI
jgi:hypothetical protein